MALYVKKITSVNVMYTHIYVMYAYFHYIKKYRELKKFSGKLNTVYAKCS